MLCDIENFSPEVIRAISHVNFYVISFPSLSQQYGKIQSGTYTVPSSGNGEIIFDPPFSAAPQLALTSVGSATDIVTAFKIKSISATKAEILALYVTDSGIIVANSPSNIHWIACEG